MTVILAILSSIWSAIGGVLKLVPYQVWVCLGLVLLGGMIFQGKGCRDFMCARHHDPRPPKQRMYDVVAVPDAAHITVAFGLRGRKQATVALYGVAVPDSVASDAQAALTKLAGEAVDIQSPVLTAEPEELSGNPGEVETLRPPPALGIAWGAQGCVQVSMLTAGWATNTTTDKAWVAAERVAKKSHSGVWKK